LVDYPVLKGFTLKKTVKNCKNPEKFDYFVTTQTPN